MPCKYLLVVAVLALGGSRMSAQAEDLRLRLPEGFCVSLFAGDELATNIYSLAIDSQGRVVVSGPGYIKTLHDDDGDGRADRATLFANRPVSGAQGLCFVGRDLICTGDNALRRLRDANGDDQADDAEGEVWAQLGHSEHGAHGIVHGPDGFLYVVCGNNSGVSARHVQTRHPPVKRPACGAILRLAPHGQHSDVFAHGFRNPYDLDFDSRGRLFTVDSDNERDHALPWYAPTRLFDVAQGMEHGWLEAGWQRSWNRPASYVDSVERLAEFGRGSPTGLVVYRHRQFPEPYRDGVFSCCWTLGRIYHVALKPEGSTYRGASQVFLEAEGDTGFAPVDMAVGPQGDLYVAIGGRGTRGSVYRIRYEPVGPLTTPRGKLMDRVLQADQPLDAWSRAQWLPVANKLGPQPFEGVLIDVDASVAEQVRAVEVLVECFDGVSEEIAIQAIALDRPDVTARVAWALGRLPDRAYTPRLLAELTENADPVVQRAAWEALATTMRTTPVLSADWTGALESSDRRVRAAMLCAASAGAGVLTVPPTPFAGASRLETLLLVKPGTYPAATGVHDGVLGAYLEIIEKSPRLDRRLEAIRRLVHALDDLHAGDGAPEVFSGYICGSLADRLATDSVPKWADKLAALFPTSDAELDRELARLLGVFGVPCEGLLPKLAGQFTDDSSPLDDTHYLIVMALVPGPRSTDVTERTAAALARLPVKLQSAGLAPDRNWPERIGELFDGLCRHDPILAAALVAQPRFGGNEHCLFVLRMAGDARQRGARRILAGLQSAADARPWTVEAIRLLDELPADEALPLVRAQWHALELRDAVVPILARHAHADDWARLVEALESPQGDLVVEAAAALGRMPKQPDTEQWATAFRALRTFCLTKEQRGTRHALHRLIEDWSSQPFDIDERPADAILAAYQPYFDWLREHQPAAFAQLETAPQGDLASWQTRLAEVDWSAGDAERGALVYQRRSCARCHTGAGKLGPDLAGIGSRLDRNDLFVAIFDPNKEVAPLYRTTMVVTRGGQVHHGLIVYESTASTLVQTGPDKTVRLRGHEIELRLPSLVSLMPTGLLNGATDQELADLHAYLRTLQARK